MSAGITLTEVAAGIGIMGGVSNLLGGGSSGGGGGGATQGTTAGGTIYDPFASYHPYFGGRLASMMGYPGGGGGGGGMAAPAGYTGAGGGGVVSQVLGGGGAPSGPVSQVAGAGIPTSGGAPAATAAPGGFMTSDPSYNWRFGQGLEAVNRTAAAKGMLGSGNRLYELMNYGQGAASQEFGAEFNRLASLAGTSQTMGSQAGSLQAQQQQQAWGSIGQGLGGLATASQDPNSMLGSWFGGGTTSGGTTDMTGFYTDPFGAGGGSSYGSIGTI